MPIFLAFLAYSILKILIKRKCILEFKKEKRISQNYPKKLCVFYILYLITNTNNSYLSKEKRKENSNDCCYLCTKKNFKMSTFTKFILPQGIFNIKTVKRKISTYPKYFICWLSIENYVWKKRRESYNFTSRTQPAHDIRPTLL